MSTEDSRFNSRRSIVNRTISSKYNFQKEYIEGNEKEVFVTDATYDSNKNFLVVLSVNTLKEKDYYTYSCMQMLFH